MAFYCLILDIGKFCVYWLVGFPLVAILYFAYFSNFSLEKNIAVVRILYVVGI
jgi:hypothetical protein